MTEHEHKLNYWVSTKIGTGGVTVTARSNPENPEGNMLFTITDSAPIFKRFRGQPFENLANWNKTEKVVYMP